MAVERFSTKFISDHLPDLHLPKKAERMLETFFLVVVVASCKGGASTPNLASPDGRTSSPVPTVLDPSTLPKSYEVIFRGTPGKVYLSFDDCGEPKPTDPAITAHDAEYTRAAIETAHNLGIKQLTFFCIGNLINNPAQAANMKLAQSYGYDLENHTKNHYSMDIKDIPAMKKEMSDQLKIIQEDLGDPNYKQSIIRPPGGQGSLNPYLWEASKEQGLAVAVWTMAPNCDSRGRAQDATAQSVIDNIKGCLSADQWKGGELILQHTVKADIEALPEIYKMIQEKGLSLGLIKDLIGRPENMVSAPTPSPEIPSVEPFPSVINFSEIVARKNEELIAA